MGFEPAGLGHLEVVGAIAGGRIGGLLGHRSAAGQVGKYPGGNVDANNALHGLFEGVKSTASHYQADYEHQVEPDEGPLRPATTRLVN